MYIEKPSCLFKSCVIKPFDDLEGLIIAIKYDKCGAEVLVRYVLYGALRYDWFYDFDVELKKPIEKGVVLLQELKNIDDNNLNLK